MLWDCESCGCQAIAGSIDDCPMCGEPRIAPTPPETGDEGTPASDATGTPTTDEAPAVPATGAAADSKGGW